ncbi:TetR family transcriptional regulator [Pseudomonas sp. SZ57]|nr:TetR family transcriptional regulator [Pseudomonas sp. SZ57]
MINSMEIQMKSRMQRDERFNNILDAGEKLFLQQGYAETTFKKIAEACEVTRPVVYEHFQRKEELFLECAKRARNHFDRELSEAISNAKNAAFEEIIYAAADVFFRMLETNPKRWMMLFGSSLITNTYLSAGLNELRASTIEIIARMMSAHLSGRHDRSSITMVAYAISGVGEQIGQWWLRNPDKTRHQIVENYVKMVTGGITSTLDIKAITND